MKCWQCDRETDKLYAARALKAAPDDQVTLRLVGVIREVKTGKRPQPRKLPIE